MSLKDAKLWLETEWTTKLLFIFDTSNKLNFEPDAYKTFLEYDSSKYCLSCMSYTVFIPYRNLSITTMLLINKYNIILTLFLGYHMRRSP